MPSDGDEYESEYDEEDSAGVGIQASVGGKTEVKAGIEAEVPTNGAGNREVVAAIDQMNESSSTVGEAAAIDPEELEQEPFTIETYEVGDQDPRDEDTAQQSARAMQSGADSVSISTQASKAPARRLAADVARCQRLERLLNQSKKANAELRNQLQQLYRNDAIAQLESRAKEKQARIDELTQENRLLKHQQRQLSKEIEDFHESKGNFPTERRALHEQLRVYKEKLRQLKDARQTSDEKLARLHQQVVDLTTKNKALSEQVRQLEEASSSPASAAFSSSRLASHSHSQEIDGIIASQEEEITRLQQRVTLMKKSHRAERSKFEKLLKVSQEEVEQTRQQLDAFEQHVQQRDKTARAQYLSLKTLKRAVHELALAHQSNRHLEQLLTEREVRYANGRSPRQRHHNHPHHSSRSFGDDNGLNHSTSAFHRQSERIYDTLMHLGYVPPLGAPGQGHQATTRSMSILSPTDASEEPSNNRDAEEPEHHEPGADVEFVQGKLMPRPPPPSSSDGQAGHPPVGMRGNSARAQLYTSRSSSSRRLSERSGSGSKVRGAHETGAARDATGDSNQAVAERDEDRSKPLVRPGERRPSSDSDFDDASSRASVLALEPSPGREA